MMNASVNADAFSLLPLKSLSLPVGLDPAVLAYEIRSGIALDTRADVCHTVTQIIQRVRKEGDSALNHLASTLDHTPPDKIRLRIDQQDIKALNHKTLDACKRAIANITAFHQKQGRPMAVETMPGILCERVYRPLERVGLYVPAGSAPLISTLMMLCIPAQIAGVPHVAVCCPLYRHSDVAPIVRAVAALLGITEVWCVGGAHAIAAMAFGTESFAPVNKIFGPGNAYVTEAKRQVAASGVAIDMLAGPSELLVLADEHANPQWVAADMLAQAEHDPDACAVLVTTSVDVADAVGAALVQQLQTLPRSAIATQALCNSAIIVCDHWQQTVDFANAFAPEHLMINAAIDVATATVDTIINAGSVFVGALSAEAIGDYASGTNHVLPTSGLAKNMGGVTVESFARSMTIQTITPKGLAAIAPDVGLLAQLEGLEGHRRSVLVRNSQ